MATLASAIAFARTQVQTNSDGLTDAKGIVFANEALYDFRRRLINNNIDPSGIQEAYRDGTVGTGTYLYPTNMFFLKAIELNYTDTDQQNYKRASQVDVSNLSGGLSTSWLRKNADPNAPQFDDRGDWYEIFPTPISSNNVSQLIRIFYYLNPTEFTATSDTISYPESLDYRILGWRIASDYDYSLGKIEEGDRLNAKYEERVTQLIGTLGRGSQQPIDAVAIQLTGFEF